jgi:hypothetical protein
VRLRRTRSFKLSVRWDDADDGGSSSLYCNGVITAQVGRLVGARPLENGWWVSGCRPGLTPAFDNLRRFGTLGACKRYVARQIVRLGLAAGKAADAR